MFGRKRLMGLDLDWHVTGDRLPVDSRADSTIGSAFAIAVAGPTPTLMDLDGPCWPIGSRGPSGRCVALVSKAIAARGGASALTPGTRGDAPLG